MVRIISAPPPGETSVPDPQNSLRELVKIADGFEGNLIVLHLRQFPVQVASKQGHENSDLLSRTLPVFFGKGEQGEIRDA
jgi:hypothetical protein